MGHEVANASVMLLLASPRLQFLFLLPSTVLPWLRLNLYFYLPFLLLLLNLLAHHISG